MRAQVVLALAGATAFLALAQPAAAQGRYYDDDYRYNSARESCERERNQRTAIGAVLGAVIGGAVGNNVAQDQSDGSVIGAVVGGVAGGALARGRNNCRDLASAYYGGEGDYGYEEPYGGPYGEDEYYEGPRQYAHDDRCRWGVMTYYDRRGRREYEERVWMCVDRDGVWRPAED
jgi:hypothetical protein